jgi:hypothetical protein
VMAASASNVAPAVPPTKVREPLPRLPEPARRSFAPSLNSREPVSAPVEVRLSVPVETVV